MTRTLLIILFTVTILQGYAQELHISGISGIGTSKIDESGYGILKFNTSQYKINYYRIGATVDYFPKDTPQVICVRIGLLYNREESNGAYLNFLELPCAFDININLSRKFSLIMGAGLSLSYLASYSGLPKYFTENKKDFQLNGFTNIGVGYSLSVNWKIKIEYQSSFGITGLYDQYHPSHFGPPLYYYPEKNYSRIIILRVSRRLYQISK